VYVNDWAPVVGVGVLAVSVGTAVVLRGPIGKALADWIRGWNHTEQRWIEGKYGTGQSTEVAALQADIEELRHRLAEAEERLDFTERLLAKTRDPERIGPGRT
jgi:hypothetical protein